MLNQFSENVDKKLHESSEAIGKQTKIINEATALRDDIWEGVKSLLDELAQDVDSPRFIAKDGFYLQLQRREGSPKLDTAKLQTVLYQIMDKKEADRIWNKITKRTVDANLLEEAVRRKIIPTRVIDECMTKAPVTYARVRNEWTKEDHNRARILGLT